MLVAPKAANSQQTVEKDNDKEDDYYKLSAIFMTISFTDFKKLDIRIGEVTEVDEVEGADRLLKLAVDLGEEDERQIISGIKQHVSDPGELVGTSVVVLVNLEPKEIYGLESQGMVLTASGGGAFGLLSPNSEVPVGTPVK